jgi:serine/threonine protein kinase
LDSVSRQIVGTQVEGEEYKVVLAGDLANSGLELDGAKTISVDEEPLDSADQVFSDDVEVLDDTILGRYRILDILGRGAFSVVYRASQVGVGRIVALKVFLLQPASQGDPKLAEAALVRFQREARLASGLRHRNTVTLYDYDRTETNVLYMAFEFVDGPTLSKYLQEQGALPPEEAIHIARQVALSLEEAHAQGIVHRDLKPGNIIVVPQADGLPEVKVLDFGIAKVVEAAEEEDPHHTEDGSDVLSLLDLTGLGEARGDITLDGRIVGTPRYIAPEQVHAKDPAPAVDIYSLGLILHELLAGRPANPHQETADLIMWHLQDQPHDAPPGFAVPAGLSKVLAKATRRNPAQRYVNCADLIADLDSLDCTGRWHKPQRSRRPLLIAAIALNVGLAALLAIIGVTQFNNADVSVPEAPAVSAENEAEAVQESPPPPPPKITEEPPAQALPKRVPPVQISVDTIPAGAEVWLADQNLGMTPVGIEVDAGEESVEFTLKKAGYAPKTVTWAPTANPFPVTLTKPRRDGKRPARPKPASKYHLLK